MSEHLITCVTRDKSRNITHVRLNNGNYVLVQNIIDSIMNGTAEYYTTTPLGLQVKVFVKKNPNSKTVYLTTNPDSVNTTNVFELLPSCR